MEEAVVITGAGVISSLADSPAGLHAALCAGRSGLRAREAGDGLGARLVGDVDPFDAQSYLGARNLRLLDRVSQLAAAAAQLALDDSGWTPEAVGGSEVGLVLGTMFCGLHTTAEFDRRALTVGPAYSSPLDFANTVINAAAGQAAIWHNLRGVNSTVATGNTSGLQALAYAADLIRGGRAEAVLAGGAEALCFEALYGFDRAGISCRASGEADGDAPPTPFDEARGGFAPGEGAALLMLESESAARSRGARVLGEVKGHGCAFDHTRGRSAEEAAGAVARAVREALRDARLCVEEVDCLSASANGSVAWDAHEARGVALALGEHARRLPVTAVKSMLGETLGAAGALQAADVLETMRDGVLPGVRRLRRVADNFPLKSLSDRRREVRVNNGLINAVGFDGQCCSLVLSRREGA